MVLTLQTLVLLLHLLQHLQLFVMSTTLATLEPHVAASLSTEGSALDGDVALLSLQHVALTRPVVALLISLSVMILDLAYW